MVAQNRPHDETPEDCLCARCRAFGLLEQLQEAIEDVYDDMDDEAESDALREMVEARRSVMMLTCGGLGEMMNFSFTLPGEKED